MIILLLLVLVYPPGQRKKKNAMHIMSVIVRFYQNSRIICPFETPQNTSYQTRLYTHCGGRSPFIQLLSCWCNLKSIFQSIRENLGLLVSTLENAWPIEHQTSNTFSAETDFWEQSPLIDIFLQRLLYQDHYSWDAKETLQS